MAENRRKGSRGAAAGQDLAERMAGMVSAPAADDQAAAPARSSRASSAATARKRSAPKTTGATVRAAAPPAEVRAPQEYKARVSHATTYDQLDALEEVAKAYRRAHGIHVPITALLRAAAAICLDNAQLRERMARDAAVVWNAPRETRKNR
jgi:hypothetical protein